MAERTLPEKAMEIRLRLASLKILTAHSEKEFIEREVQGGGRKLPSYRVVDAAAPWVAHERPRRECGRALRPYACDRGHPKLVFSITRVIRLRGRTFQVDRR